MTPLIHNLGVIVFLPLLYQLLHTPFRRSSWPQQALEWAVSALLVASLWRSIALYWAFGLTLLFGAIYIYRYRPVFRWNAVSIASIAYVAWWFVSLLWSAVKPRGAAMAMEILPLAVLCILSGWIRFSTAELIRIFRPFIQAACLFIIAGLICVGYYCWIYEIRPWEWPFFQKSQLDGHLVYQVVYAFLGGFKGYTHPSYNGLPLFLSALVALWSYRQCSHTTDNTSKGNPHMVSPDHSSRNQSGSTSLLIAAIFILFGTLLLSLFAQSRIGLIFFTIIFLSALITSSPFMGGRANAVGLFLIVATICLSAGFMRTTSHSHFFRDPVRSEMHDLCWQYVKAKPFTGSGVGALNPVEMARTVSCPYWPNVGTITEEMSVSNWPYRTKMLPHNQFIADWAQTGIIGFLLSLLLYLSMFLTLLFPYRLSAPLTANQHPSYRCRPSYCSRCRSFYGGLFLMLFVLFSFIEPPLFIPKGMYLFAILPLISPHRDGAESESR